MDNKKTIRVTFYVVAGLLLGAPYLWKLIRLIPELLSTLPNAVEILTATGYTALLIGSMVIAFKLGEALWIRIVAVYSSVALGVCVLVLLTRALGGNEIFRVLFELVCAPFYGIDSPMTVIVIMLALAITGYSLLNRLPQKTPAAPAPAQNPAQCPPQYPPQYQTQYPPQQAPTAPPTTPPTNPPTQGTPQ
ncbi:MAG: hypothetical protein IJK64_05330 [Clostridia bacterium]|nr:hypothetical protein [Clostridia bacterium]